MNVFSKKTLAAGFVLALTFFGCSSGDKSDDPQPSPQGTSSGATDGSSSSEGGSSSSDGGSSSSVGGSSSSSDDSSSSSVGISSSSDDGSSLAVDKTALGTEIAAADIAKEGAGVSANGSNVNPEDFWVTQAQMTALENAITAAKTVKDKADATQAEVETATSTLTAAIATFNAAKQAGTNPDAAVKTELKAALAAAETAKDYATLTISTDGSDVFTTDKWVTSTQKTALDAAIAAAKAVKDYGSATQAEVDNATAALQTAISTFETAKQPGSVTKCGNRTNIYNPDIYECKPSINPNGIYLKSKPVDPAGKEYEAVLIGTQTWMAENLNYKVTGSRCHGDNSGGDSQNRCDTYGRLYDWATAMTGSNCTNSVRCSTDPTFNHQGICPDGWHVPSGAEWQTLMNFVDETSLTSPAKATTAGKKLKATSGWISNGNGTDDYGFAALPSGYGISGGDHYSIGSGGNWWSASEYDASHAYYRHMAYDSENAYWNNSYYKANLQSVRCVKD